MNGGERIYRLLLRAYPRAFRDRFSTEMVALFSERRREAEGSRAGRVRFWTQTLTDVWKSALAERFPSRHFDSPPRGSRLGSLATDVRQAWRTVTRAPLLSTFIIAIMGLTIGTTTAVFTAVNALLLRPFPFARPDRIVMVWERQSADNGRNVVGGHEFAAWQSRSRAFGSLAAMTFDRDFTLTGAGDPLAVTGVRVTSQFFPALGVSPQLGGVFGADADETGHGDVVVLSDRLWRERFGADPAIVGRAVQLNDRPFTVLGVMPAAFRFPAGAAGAPPDLWTPIAEPVGRYVGRHYLFVVGRLADGVSVDRAQADLSSVAAGIAREFPPNRSHTVNVQPLQSDLVAGVRTAMLVTFAAVGLVLLIGCCNVANLLLARASARQHELAVRAALGAGLWRIGRQLILEAALVSAASAAAGLLLARWLISWAVALMPRDVPRADTMSIDPSVLAFAFAVAGVTTVIFGIVPLRQLRRVQVADRLKHGSRGVTRADRHPLRSLLVVCEVALTMVVAVAATLLIRSLVKLQSVDPGFNASQVIAFDVALPASRYGEPARQRELFDQALDRIGALPGVQAVSATNLVPQGGGVYGIAIAIDGRPRPRRGEELSAGMRIVSPGYFRSLNIPLTAGRDFAGTDARVALPLIRWYEQQPRPAHDADPQPMPVAVVNDAMARRFWPGETVLGRRFRVLFSPPITVIGVVKDARDWALSEAPGPEFYLTNLQEPQSRMTILSRSQDPPEAMLARIRAQIQTLDPALPLARVRTLEEIVDANVSLHRFMSSLIGGFAVLSLLLMSLGVYAVIAYVTAQRRHEMGVRLALGAQPGDVRRMIVGRSLAISTAGIVAGAAGAYALARYAAALLYEVTPAEPRTYLAIVALVLAIVAIASWLPARSAGRIDPLRVLRSE